MVLLTAQGDNIDGSPGWNSARTIMCPKPSSPGELVARLRTIMRQVRPWTRGVIKTGALVLWPEASARPSGKAAHWADQYRIQPT